MDFQSVPNILSVPKKRWNFKLANWENYSKDLDDSLQRSGLAATCKNYTKFVDLVKESAKKNIPRGVRLEYIPTWDRTCSALLEEFQQTENRDKASQLFNYLNTKRKERWEQVTANMDFKHSSRKAWSLLNKLGTDGSRTSRKTTMTPNQIATRLLQTSKAGKINSDRKRTIKNDLMQKKRNLLPDPKLSTNFSLEELTFALKKIKKGKAAGVDGIFPEFLRYAGPVTRNWILSLFNYILNKGTVPSLCT